MNKLHTYTISLLLVAMLLVCARAPAQLIVSAPELLDEPGGGGGDIEPQISTDAMGNWVAVWGSTENLGGTAGTDADILVATISISVGTGMALSPTIAVIILSLLLATAAAFMIHRKTAR